MRERGKNNLTDKLWSFASFVTLKFLRNVCLRERTNLIYLNQAHSQCVQNDVPPPKKNLTTSFDFTKWATFLSFFSMNNIKDTTATCVSELWPFLRKNICVTLDSLTFLSSTPLFASWISCCLSRKPSLVIAAIFCRLSLSWRPSSL